MNKTMKTRKHILPLAAAMGSLALATSANAALIGHWTFDEGSGTTAADSSGNGYTATQVSSTTGSGWVAGKSGNAYNLARFHVNALDSAALDLGGGTAVTLSTWVKGRTGTSWEGIAGFENNPSDIWGLKLNKNPISWNVAGNGLISSPETIATYAAATADGWVHLAGVFGQGNTHTLYVNGSPVVSGTSTNVITDFTGIFAMGTYSNGTNSSTFSIDDVQVYDQALDSTEVASLFANPGLSLDAIPEPSTTALLGLGGLALILRRRK